MTVADACTCGPGADKMRSEYGKLVYLLMDSADGHIQELIEFRCVRPLRTVYTTLGARIPHKQRGAVVEAGRQTSLEF